MVNKLLGKYLYIYHHLSCTYLESWHNQALLYYKCTNAELSLQRFHSKLSGIPSLGRRRESNGPHFDREG